MQESFVKLINENAEAGWKASMNPRFSNYTVSFLIIEVVYIESSVATYAHNKLNKILNI